MLEDRAVIELACSEFAHRIWIGLDAREGKVAVRGWTDVTCTTVQDLLRSLEGDPLGSVIYTDIAKDGMLEGPNLTALREVVNCSPVPVIASGGITRIEDIQAIKAMGSRVQGVIVGKALYDGKLALKVAQQAAE